MKDMQAHLEKLRVQASECELIRDLAMDPEKRALFDRLATQFRMMIADLERAVAGTPPPYTFLGRKTQEPFPSEEE
jgi:hypothetical protein